MVKKGAVEPIVVSPSQAWDGNDGPWSTFSIHAGTPPQPARVLVATTIGETWVISQNETQGGCLKSDSPGCAESRGALFNINASTSWQDKGIYELGNEINLPDYITGYDNGHYGIDSLGLGLPGGGGVALDNQVVAALATKDFYLGYLGVTSRPTNFSTFDNPHTSFLSSLKQQNKIPSLTFGYSAGNQYRLKKVYGSLTLGGYDQSRFIPNDVSFQFADDVSRDLVVGLQSITYSDSSNTNSVLLSQGILTFIDATVPHIWLPKTACAAFEKAFHLEYNSTVNRYLVNDTLHAQLLKQNASVSFLLGNDITGGSTVNITLPYAAFDLQLRPPIVNSSTGYFPLRRADNDTQYTLGRTLLQESYLLVDYERNNFSISQSLFQNTPQKIVAVSANGTGPDITKHSSSPSSGGIAGIAIGCAAVLALVGLAFLFIRRRRQRRRLEEEKRKAEAEFDPTAKPEMDGNGKAPLGELFAAGKPGIEADGQHMTEMEGSKGAYFNDVKLRAEMEGSQGDLTLRAEMDGTRGGSELRAEMDGTRGEPELRAEMEGTKGGHEMQAGKLAPPVEMWAGSHGLYELPSPQPGDSGRPSPASQMRSPSESSRPSPIRNSRISWSRRKQRTPSFPRDEGSDMPSPPDDSSSEQGHGIAARSRQPKSRPAPPRRTRTAQDVSPQSSRDEEHGQRDSDFARRFDSRVVTPSNAHLSVSSPSTDSKRQTNESGTDRRTDRSWNRPRNHISSQALSVSSPGSASRSREPTLPPTPRDSPIQEVPPQSERGGRRGRLGKSGYSSWTSQVSEGRQGRGLDSPGLNGRRDETGSGGLF